MHALTNHSFSSPSRLPISRLSVAGLPVARQPLLLAATSLLMAALVIGCTADGDTPEPSAAPEGEPATDAGVEPEADGGVPEPAPAPDGGVPQADAGAEPEPGPDAPLPIPVEVNRAAIRIDVGTTSGYEAGTVAEEMTTFGGADDNNRQTVLYTESPFELRLIFFPQTSGTYACGVNPFPDDGGRPIRMELQRVSPPFDNARARENNNGSCTLDLVVEGTEYSGTFDAVLEVSSTNELIEVSGAFRFTGES